MKVEVLSALPPGWTLLSTHRSRHGLISPLSSFWSRHVSSAIWGGKALLWIWKHWLWCLLNNCRNSGLIITTWLWGEGGCCVLYAHRTTVHVLLQNLSCYLSYNIVFSCHTHMLHIFTVLQLCTDIFIIQNSVQHSKPSNNTPTNSLSKTTLFFYAQLGKNDCQC